MGSKCRKTLKLVKKFNFVFINRIFVSPMSLSTAQIKAMQKKLVGQTMFGCVDLIKTERSKVAEMAGLLD